MPASNAIRPMIPLVIGIVLGGMCALFLRDSLPGKKGSPEEQAAQLEVDLKRANNRILALESTNNTQPRFLSRVTGGPNQTPGAGNAADLALRRIIDDIRAGRDVDPDEIFRLSQPAMRDLAPLFERIRVKSQLDQIDKISGELSRRYDLSPAAEESLKQWFQQRSAEDARNWSELIARPATTLPEILRATASVRPDDGLDAFMPSLLSGDKLAQFQSERWTERVGDVQNEADMNLHRVDQIVHLDDSQRNQVFGIFARSSPDYDPAMGVVDGVGVAPVGDPQAALLSVLNPSQQALFQAEQQRRRDEATKNFSSVGLSLPASWNMFNDLIDQSPRQRW